MTLGGDTSNRNQTVRKEPSRRQRWRVFWASLSLIRQRTIQVDVFRRKVNIISKYRLSLVPRPLEIHLRRDMLPFSFVYLPVKFHSLCSFGGEMKVKNETCSFTSNPARQQPSKCRGWGLCWWSRGWESAFQCRGPGFYPWLGNYHPTFHGKTAHSSRALVPQTIEPTHSGACVSESIAREKPGHCSKDPLCLG